MAGLLLSGRWGGSVPFCTGHLQDPRFTGSIQTDHRCVRGFTGPQPRLGPFRAVWAARRGQKGRAEKVSPHSGHICVRECDFLVIFQMEGQGPYLSHQATDGLTRNRVQLTTDFNKESIMKKILAVTALIAASSTASFAMNMDGELTTATKMEARQLVPNADLDNLTPAQARAIANAVHSDESGAAALIRSILANG